MRIVAWILAAGLAGWAVLRVGGLDRGHPFVAAVSFTPYAAAAGLPVMALLGAARQWKPLALTAVAAFALAAAVLPRTLHAGGGGDGYRLRVLTVNVTFGSVPAEAVTDLVADRRVDLLSVQELTPEFHAALRQAGIERLLPHAVVRPEGGATGTGLYARLPLQRLPPPRGGPFAQTAARLMWLGTVDVVSVHPPPPVSAQHVEGWHETFRGLPRAGDRPRILAGDFNATLDHRALRRLIDSGYTDAAEATGNGLKATWPVGRGLRPGLAIDHVLSTRHLRPASTEMIELPRGDHRAVYAELVAHASIR